jgi:competence CoiA-like predicted nuclease
MLQAVDVQTGALVPGDEARRDGRYLCPECRTIVGLRLGARKVPHFAHLARTACALGKPESQRHQALKWLCKKFFAPLGVNWEVTIGDRRADVVVGNCFVVECQVSPLSIGDWQARTECHNRHGYPVLWLWDIKRLCRRNTLEEAFALERNGRPVWTAPELRLCHAESRELLYVADKHTITACKLISLSAGEQAQVKKIGRAWPEAFFWPQALRKLSFNPEFDKAARFHFASQTKKLRLVRFGANQPDHRLET